ncbi:hypothetical protein SULYE_1151, partial [Sulfurihydrogenibium yellowstonense SS-5]
MEGCIMNIYFFETEDWERLYLEKKIQDSGIQG